MRRNLLQHFRHGYFIVLAVVLNGTLSASLFADTDEALPADINEAKTAINRLLSETENLTETDRLKTEEFVRQLQRYRKHKMLAVRVHAGCALLSVQPDNAKDLVAELAAEVRDSKVMSLYAQDIAQAAPQVSATPLLDIAMVESDTSRTWRVGVYGICHLLPELEDRIRQDFEQYSDVQKIRLLSAISEAAEAGSILEDVVGQALQSSSPDVRLNAAFTQFSILKTEARQVLGDKSIHMVKEFTAQFSQQPESTKQQILNSIARFEKHKETLRLLELGLSDPSGAIRFQSAEIAELHNSIELSELIPAMVDGLEVSRHQLSAHLLWRKHLDQIAPALDLLEKNAKETDSPRIALEAALILTELSPERFEEFEPMFSDRLASERYYAAAHRRVMILAGELGPRAASLRDELRSYLSRDRQRLRGQAAVTLMTISDIEEPAAMDAISLILSGAVRTYDDLERWPKQLHFPSQMELKKQLVSAISHQEAVNAVEMAIYLWNATGEDRDELNRLIEERYPTTDDPRMKAALSFGMK